jgi:glycosyltransferase involved in cell wall biosynthesis
VTLPAFTLVTPSFNQGRFLERTIRSVLGQRYPFVEYIVMDGGSTDGSLEVLHRYAPWLAHWQSGPDGGQARAILDGLSRATGTVLGFLNSDDVLLPGALWEVARRFEGAGAAEVATGHTLFIDAEDRILSRGWMTPPDRETLLFWGCTFAQPSSFWTRRAFEAVGGFDGTLRFSFDLDLFLRLCSRYPVVGIDRQLAAMRWHDASKTSTMKEVCAAENAGLRERAGAGAGSRLRGRMVAARARARDAVHRRLMEARLRAGLDPSPGEEEIAAWFALLRDPAGVLGAPVTAVGPEAAIEADAPAGPADGEGIHAAQG